MKRYKIEPLTHVPYVWITEHSTGNWVKYKDVEKQGWATAINNELSRMYALLYNLDDFNCLVGKTHADILCDIEELRAVLTKGAN